MPRDGAIIFADLIGKLDVLYVHCAKCSRADRYRVERLIDERGRNATVIDWLDESSMSVCFTPESGHVRCKRACLLWANSRRCTIQSSECHLC
jgi:hypothetical protein